LVRARMGMAPTCLGMGWRRRRYCAGRCRCPQLLELDSHCLGPGEGLVC
jgi:hypothetical protein